MDYMYGNLDKSVVLVTYTGIDSDSAKTHIDNETNTIKVTVPGLIVVQDAIKFLSLQQQNNVAAQKEILLQVNTEIQNLQEVDRDTVEKLDVLTLTVSKYDEQLIQTAKQLDLLKTTVGELQSVTVALGESHTNFEQRITELQQALDMETSNRETSDAHIEGVLLQDLYLETTQRSLADEAIRAQIQNLDDLLTEEKVTRSMGDENLLSRVEEATSGTLTVSTEDGAVLGRFHPSTDSNIVIPNGPRGTSLRNMGSWELDINYYGTVDDTYLDIITHNNAIYMCKQSHVSEVITEPGVGESWQNYWTLMLSLNN